MSWFDPVLGVLMIPLIAAAVLAILPGYRISAGFNIAASFASLACAVKIDDFALGKLCVFSYAIQVDPKFRVITDGNFD